MSNTSLVIITGLLGFIQVIFMFILAYIFKTHGTLYSKLDENRGLIDKCKIDVEEKFVSLLDTHYVTNGQLTTMEQKLMGEIGKLTNSIEHLTEAINKKL